MVQQITVRELKSKLDAKEPLHLLDVRQPSEHAIAALPNSQLIPLGELAARANEIRLGKQDAVVVYCHHGIRSLTAAAFLETLGYRAFSLAGGIDGWSLEIDPRLPRY